MIKILFFGSIAERQGKREYTLSIDEVNTVGDIVQAVGCGDFHPLLVAVNQEQVNDMSMLMNDGDEVAMMPPFSGG